MKIKTTLVSFALLLSSGLAQATPSFAYLPSIPTLDGHVNSFWEMDIQGDELKIGTEGNYIAKRYKSIVTFDTSNQPPSDTLRSAKILLNYAALPEGMDGSDIIYYLWENIQIEVAGPAGFSGSPIVSPLDYYGLSVAVLGEESLMWGMGYNVSLDITDYINFYGYTQVAISLKSNPENIVMSFMSGEVIGEYEWDSGPSLFLIYE